MREVKNAVALAIIIGVALAGFAIAANAQSTNAAVCKLSAGGSGTLIGVSGDDTKALVISCYHVCGGHSTINCAFNNVPELAGKSFPGRVVKLDRRNDLAAVLIFNPRIPPAAIGDFKRHDGIYSACGFGGGKYSAARGPVISMSRDITVTRCGIYPGHSGGGLFDPFGGYCGVTNWNSGHNGPNVNGWSRCRSGEPLEKFIREATYECGVFSRWRSRKSGGGGGDEICPPGGCPNPNVPSLPGAGYGLAPEYKPLTPLASAPQAAPIQQQAPLTMVGPATITQPAPVPQATPIAAAPVTPAAPAVEPPQENPLVAIAQQLEAASRYDREQQAATAALAAYRAAMAGEAQQIQRLPAAPDATVEAKDPSTLVNNIPVVVMSVEYRENDGRVRVESAKLDLPTYVRQAFGFVSEEKSK